jgi:hypothetical protein
MSDKLEKVMKLEHMNSQISLRKWLKESLVRDSGVPIYKKDDVIPEDHILIFLDHIDRQINDQMPEEHREWMASVKNIRSRLEKNE